MKEAIALFALFLMALGTGFIFIDWYTAGISTLMISIVFCVTTGLPFFAKMETDGGDHQ